MATICNPIFCQNWEWTKPGLGRGEGEAICADNSGNIYTTGSYSSQNIIFGQYTLNNSSGSAINSNIYIVKYDSNGNVKWAKSGSGINNIGTSITTDNFGYIYVTGSFSDNLTFSTYTLNGVNGIGNFFILKLDSLGNVLWGKSAGIDLYTTGNSIVHDAHDNVYVIGNYKSSSVIFGNDTLKNKGFEDFFVVKYNSNTGNEIWAKSFGDSLGDYGNAITVNKKGEIYLTGNYWSSNIMLDTFNLQNPWFHTNNLFIAKCDSLGKVIWAKNIGGDNDDISMGICLDKNENIYITGVFTSTSGMFDTINVSTSIGFGNIFIAKYNSLGHIIWLKTGRTTHSGYGYGLAVDSYNNLYASGGTQDNGSIDFMDVVLNAPAANCIANRCDPMYLMKYDSLGHLLCSTYISSGGDDISGLCVDKNGYAYVTGDYLANPFIIGNDTLPLAGFESIFTSKFYCCEKPKLQVSNVIENICKGDSINISLSGALNYNWYSSLGSSQNTSIIIEKPISNVIYTAIGTGAFDSCRDTVLLNINVRDCNESFITIPNVFTPNGDNVNDVFAFKIEGTLKDFSIYNRWGNLIKNSMLTSQSYINWDGHTTSGEECSSGVYFFTLQYTTLLGEQKKVNGYVTLIR